jgi:hypothetical protein
VVSAVRYQHDIYWGSICLGSMEVRPVAMVRDLGAEMGSWRYHANARSAKGLEPFCCLAFTSLCTTFTAASRSADFL